MVSKEELRQMRDDNDVQGLLAALSDDSYHIRGDAAIGLGGIADIALLKPLISLLKDKESYVRQYAARGLGRLAFSFISNKEQSNPDLSAAIPPLLRLLKDDDDWVRAHAAETIGMFSGIHGFGSYPDEEYLYGDIQPFASKKKLQNAILPLINTLQDESTMVRYMTATALGKINDPKAVEPLNKCLSDTNTDVIRSSAKALGFIGDPQAIQPLEAIIKHKDQYVRYDVVKALANLGPEAKSALEKARKDRSNDVKYEAIAALDRIEAQSEKKPPIEDTRAKKLKLLNDHSRDIRSLAAHYFRPEEKNLPLTIMLNTIVAEKDRIKRDRYIALLDSGLPSEAEVYIELLNCSDERQRIDVIDALKDITDPKALERLEERFHIEIKDHIKVKIILAMGTKGTTAIEPLQKIWRSGRYQPTILTALGTTKDTALIQFLSEALNSDDLEVREAAVSGLGSIGKPALQTLLGIHDEHEGGVRAEAIRQIGNIDGPGNRELIYSALKDKSWEVRSAAAYEIGEMKGALATPELLKAVHDRKREVRIYAIMALGKIGDVACFDDIEKRLNDRDGMVAYRAEEVLNNFLHTGATRMGYIQDIIFVCLAIAHLGVDKTSEKAMERISNFVYLTQFSEAEKRTSEPGEELFIAWDGSDPFSQKFQKTLEDASKFYKMLFEAKGGDGILYLFRKCVLLIGKNHRNHPESLRVFHGFLKELASYHDPLPEMSNAFLEYLEQTWFEPKKPKKRASKPKAADRPVRKAKQEADIEKSISLEDITVVGKRFVITGTYPGKTRKEFESLLYQHGGALQKSVTKQTDYLIIGNEAGTSKISKAMNLQVPSIDAKKFQEVIAQSPKVQEALKLDVKVVTKPDLKALSSKDKDARIQTINQIGRTKHMEGVDALLDALKENDPDIQNAAVASIKELGKAATNKLVEILAEDSKGTYYDCFNQINTILTSPLRKEIAKTKGIRHTGTVDVLSFRLQCVMELEKQLQEGESQLVIDALDDARKEVPAIAATVLGRMKVKEAVNALVEKIHDKEHVLAEAAVVALGRIGDPIVFDALLDLINEKRIGIVVAAIDALGDLGDKRAVEPLSKVSMEKTESGYLMERHSTKALVKIGDKRALDTFTKIYGEKIGNRPFDEPIILEQIKELGGKKLASNLERERQKLIKELRKKCGKCVELRNLETFSCYNMCYKIGFNNDKMKFTIKKDRKF